jgi:ABC-type Fe3+ transport system permease subunit
MTQRPMKRNDYERFQMTTEDWPAEGTRRPADHLVASVIAILFFWPTAIVAVNYAFKVSGLCSKEDWYRAEFCSRKARNWSIFSYAVGGSIAATVFTFGAVLGSN